MRFVESPVAVHSPTFRLLCILILWQPMHAEALYAVGFLATALQVSLFCIYYTHLLLGGNVGCYITCCISSHVTFLREGEKADFKHTFLCLILCLTSEQDLTALPVLRFLFCRLAVYV